MLSLNFKRNQQITFLNSNLNFYCMKIALFKPLSVALGWLLLVGTSGLAQQSFPQNGAHDQRTGRYAFVNATVVADPTTVLSNATLVIENGLVKAVGKNVAIPQGTVVIDATGKYLYPSFLDLHSSYGMPTPVAPEPRSGRSGPQLESNKKGIFGWNQAINAEQRSSALFTADQGKASEMRNTGFGSVLTHYPDGIVRGTGALATLANEPSNTVFLKSDASAHFSFSKGTSTQNYPNSIMGSVALLRQTYYDAEWHEKGGKKEEQNLSLESFNQIKKLPSFFETNDKWSLLRADQIGDEFGVQYIIKGGGDEYQRINEIKSSNAPVIVPVNFPDAYDVTDPWDADVITMAELKHWEAAPGNLAAMEKAGIEFAITAHGLKKTSDLLVNVRKAIRYGLSPAKALEALTATPAKLIQASHLIGSLKPGLVANLLVASGDLFEEETLLLENWIQGKKYAIPNASVADLRGEYNFYINQVLAGKLSVKGKLQKQEYQLTLSDTLSITPKVSAERDLITLSYQADKKNPGLSRFTGWRSGNTWSGSGELPNGEKVSWRAEQTSPFAASETKEERVDSPLAPPPIVYPFVGLGNETLPVQEPILFKNATVWTLENEGTLNESDVLIQDGKIAKIGKNLPSPSGVRVIDATGKHLTPGLVDEHSHIALFGVNEGSQSSSAEVRMKDAINPDDVNIYRQLAGGVTTSQLLHGSANAIGGQSAVIKLKWGASPEKLLIPEAKYIKFALGENVKQSNWGDANRVRYPQTRMGVEQVYYDHFIRAREYEKNRTAYDRLRNKNGVSPPRRDLELDALAEILRDERHITCHSYVQSEINMLMSVADSLKFKINTFTHILEGYKLADKMAERKIGGSAFADWWAYKMEVKEAIPYNAALMTREGVTVAINSDDAEMARRLNQEAAKTVTFGGISEIEALKMVTLNPAKLLRLDHRMGSIKPGKDADLVLWNEHPLSIYASPDYTLIEGAIFFSKEDDNQKQQRISAERARLIQLSIDAKAAGASTQAPQSVRPRMWHCEDILGEHAEHEHHDHQEASH
jgi:imidazolonepropionase-like amidohydrolase